MGIMWPGSVVLDAKGNPALRDDGTPLRRPAFNMTGMERRRARPSPLVVVWLSEYLEGEAERLGTEQEERARKRRYPNRNAPSTPEESLAQNINAMRAEMAVGLALGGEHREPRTERDQFKGPDIGSFYQVRSTGKYDRNLLYEHHDNPLHPYILVVSQGRYKMLFIYGWMYGHECKRPTWKRKGRESWKVPPSALHPMPTLPADPDPKYQHFHPIWEPLSPLAIRVIEDDKKRAKSFLFRTPLGT